MFFRHYTRFVATNRRQSNQENVRNASDRDETGSGDIFSVCCSWPSFLANAPVPDNVPASVASTEVVSTFRYQRINIPNGSSET